MTDEIVDVVIVGGGLVGASLLRALAGLPLRAAIVEPVTPADRWEDTFDSKAIALTPTSQRIFQSLGCWEAIAPHALPIDQIHVSDRGLPGLNRFSRADHRGEPLGHVVSLHLLQTAIQSEQPSARLIRYCPASVVSITPTCPAELILNTGQRIIAQLVVGADGAESFIRDAYGIETVISDFKQTALVANIGLSRSHQAVAYERFTAEGPLAMLPLPGNRSGLIWSMPPNRVASRMAMDERSFLSLLQTEFGYRLGRFTQLGKRFSFPLVSLASREIFRPGMVLVGNAAHALHPIAGQGFNLGLRDVALLYDVIKETFSMGRLGALRHLQSYAQKRERDIALTQTFCDWVPRLFSTTHPLVVLGRDLGMGLIEHCPPLKKTFLRQNMGFHAASSSLASGIPLNEGCDGM